MNADVPFCEGALLLPVERASGGLAMPMQDWVADEVPVALSFNEIPYAVTLATPLDLDDLALGFALGEGIVREAHELYAVARAPSASGITLRMTVSKAAFARMKQEQRSQASRAGWGMEGVESLDETSRSLPVLAAGTRMGFQAIRRGIREFELQRTLQEATGTVHAAAWCSAQGEIKWLREDVSCHNAIDKLAGALLANDVDPSIGFVVVTGRPSFEMVRKAAMAGVPLLVSMSAPTSLAVAAAQRAELTLATLARHEELMIYSHSRRVAGP